MLVRLGSCDEVGPLTGHQDLLSCVWGLGWWGCIFLHLNCVSWGNIWKRPSRLSPFGHYSLVSVLPTYRTIRGRSLLPAWVSLPRPAALRPGLLLIGVSVH